MKKENWMYLHFSHRKEYILQDEDSQGDNFILSHLDVCDGGSHLCARKQDIIRKLYILNKLGKITEITGVPGPDLKLFGYPGYGSSSFHLLLKASAGCACCLQNRNASNVVLEKIHF
jgi:hypothetical protein